VNVRGQEGDRWKGEVLDPEIPDHLGRIVRQDWVNRRYMQSEEATPQARTFAEGLEFMRTNRAADSWYLQIETFDPHEPFFTLQHWKEKYNHDWEGPHFDWPKYERVSEDPDAVEHLRYEYAALLTQCDHYLGVVMDLMDELDLWEDTLLMVCTDHGFLLGEHDWWAKVRMPFYNEIAHIPLFVWDPRAAIRGEHRASLTQTIDLGPTLLEFFGIEPTDSMQGRSLRSVIEGDEPIRDAGLYGVFGGHVNVTDGRYVYMRAPATPDNWPLHHYTLMPMHMRSPFTLEELKQMSWHAPFSFTKDCPVMRIPASIPGGWYHDLSTRLYDLATDAGQERPVDDAGLEADMAAKLERELAQSDAPSEQYERLGLTSP
jgi:arylsulfatase A-like enzyme